MKNISYASIVGSLMYARVCSRPDINFALEMLDRYQSNSDIKHWIAAKMIMKHLKRTKDFMLKFRKFDQLEVIGYSDSDYAGSVDSRKLTYGYIFLMAGGAISWKDVK